MVVRWQPQLAFPCALLLPAYSLLILPSLQVAAAAVQLSNQLVEVD